MISNCFEVGPSLGTRLFDIPALGRLTRNLQLWTLEDDQLYDNFSKNYTRTHNYIFLHLMTSR